MAESVQKATTVIAEITAASREQAQGIAQISTAVASMDKVVQQAAAGAEESASLSVDMSNQADKLNEVVDKLAALVSGSKGKSVEGPRNVPVAEKTFSAARSSRASAPTDVKVKKAARSSLRSPRPEKIIPLEMADLKEF